MERKKKAYRWTYAETEGRLRAVVSSRGRHIQQLLVRPTSAAVFVDRRQRNSALPIFEERVCVPGAFVGGGSGDVGARGKRRKAIGLSLGKSCQI